jgi:hypothetical protein
MSQKHVLTALAIFAVTGAVSVPDCHAVVWRLDVSDRHAVDRGGLEWNPLIHTVADTGAPTHDPEYQTLGHPRQGPLPLTPPAPGIGDDRSRHTGEYKSGSSGSDGRYSTNPSDNYFQKESSGAPTAPFSETIYGGVPTTPSADPLVRELSRQ